MFERLNFRVVCLVLLVVSLASIQAFGADAVFMRRQIADVRPVADDLTANARGASYKALFGVGDSEADQLKGVLRFGELTVAAGGASAIVSYPAEEQLYFVTEGSGFVVYDGARTPIKKNDFMYLPVGVRHGVAGGSSGAVKVIVMGYRIPAEMEVKPTEKLMIASADDVALQVLGSHGPTTQFKLLMGTTSSQRDKLASAYLMNSLFIMDFAPGGTNIPHNHPVEEEIYLLLRGSGEMVAGKDADGNDVRHPVKEGAAFFIKPSTQVGFYSAAKEGEPHDIILAVRSRVPGMSMRGGGGGRGKKQ